MKRAAGLVLCVAALLSGCGPAPEPETDIDITIAGGAAQGSAMALAEGIGTILRREYPKVRYTYEPGSLVKAAMMALRGEVPVALAGGTELLLAQRRLPPFEQLPAGNLDVIARVSDGMLSYFVARRDFMEQHAVTSLADIVSRRVPVRISIGQPGNLTANAQARAYLAGHALSPEQIEAWGGTVYQLPKGASFALMQDGRLDVTFTASFHPDARILELQRVVDVGFLQMQAAVLERLAPEVGVEPATLAQGSYTFVERPFASTALQMYLVAGPTADERLVFRLAGALHRQFDYLRSLHPAFASFEPQMLPRSGGARLHPGAARYYRDAGLLPAASGPT